MSYFFRRDSISQLRFLSTSTLPIHQLTVKLAQYQLHTVKVWEFFLVHLLWTKLTELVGDTTYCGFATF